MVIVTASRRSRDLLRVRHRRAGPHLALHLDNIQRLLSGKNVRLGRSGQPARRRGSGRRASLTSTAQAQAQPQAQASPSDRQRLATLSSGVVQMRSVPSCGCAQEDYPSAYLHRIQRPTPLVGDSPNAPGTAGIHGKDIDFVASPRTVGSKGEWTKDSRLADLLNDTRLSQSRRTLLSSGRQPRNSTSSRSARRARTIVSQPDLARPEATPGHQAERVSVRLGPTRGRVHTRPPPRTRPAFAANHHVRSPTHSPVRFLQRAGVAVFGRCWSTASCHFAANGTSPRRQPGAA